MAAVLPPHIPGSWAPLPGPAAGQAVAKQVV